MPAELVVSTCSPPPHFDQAIQLLFLNLGSSNSLELLYGLLRGFPAAFEGS
jgi:hypothetical protein